jgi:hypothetical protein
MWALTIIVSFLIIVVAVTLFGLWFGEMLIRAASLVGVGSDASDAFATLIGLAVACALGGTMMDRAAEGKWWWQ